MIKQTDVDKLVTRLKSSLNSVPNQPLARAHVTLDLNEICFDDWLMGSSTQHIFYLKSHNHQQEYIGFGVCKQWAFKQNDFQQANHQLKRYLDNKFNVYTTIMFQSPDKAKDEQWQCLDDMMFTIPIIEFIKTTDSLTIICNCPSDIAKDDIICQSYLAKAFEFTNEPLIFPDNIEHQSETPNINEWEDHVNRIVSLIEKSKLSKLILARKTEYQISNNTAIKKLLRDSLKKEPNCNIFFYKIDNKTAFLSITPETLYSRLGRTIKCDAIAGTIGKGASKNVTQQLAESLLACKKNIAEHNFVLTFLTNQLTVLCNHVQTTKLQTILELAYVQHIYSVIEGSLKESITDFDILQHLHPTPATGGVPQSKGMALLAQNESFNRGLYAGAVGILSKDFSEVFVGIRSCLMQDQSLYLYAGAGIVENSNPNDEWAELDLKVKSYLSCYNDALCQT
ncbi:hypothetical protein CL657_04130 [bacterium]|nr:hypothetical protein [bacterium]